MKETQYEIELPFFNNGYLYDPFDCGTIYDDIKERLDDLKEWFEDDSLTSNNFTFDEDNWENDCSKVFVESFADRCPAFILYAGFSKCFGYGFGIPKVFANVVLTDGWQAQAKRFLDKNQPWLMERMDEEWNDGVEPWSFMSNQLYDWYNELHKDETAEINIEAKIRAMYEELEKDSVDERYLSAMIGYIMLKEDESVVNMNMCICEYMQPTSYVLFKKGGKTVHVDADVFIY